MGILTTAPCKIVVKYLEHLKTGLVRFANGPILKWLGCVITILMLGNCHSYLLPFEYQTLKSLVFRWIQYSDCHCTWNIWQCEECDILWPRRFSLFIDWLKPEFVSCIASKTSADMLQVQPWKIRLDVTICYWMKKLLILGKQISLTTIGCSEISVDIL